LAVKLDLTSTLEEFALLEREWNALLPHNAVNEIFLTWEWQWTWWNAYLPGDLWILSARDEDGDLIGIAPWFVEQPSRVVRTIGCVEVTDYLDVLVRPAYREAFFAALADFVAEHANDFVRMVLCNIPGMLPVLEILPPLLTERGFSVTVKQEEVCPVINLPGDFEAYLNDLDKKQRHELRRKLRKAEGSESEKVDWYIVGPGHDLSAEIEKFLGLMASSHTDKARFLQDPKNMAFFRAMIPRVALCGWLFLTFLTVDDVPAAAYLSFDYNNRILVYNSGLLPDGYAHLSPGIVLLTYNIRHAIERGRTAVDFLRGNEEYKYRMGGRDHPVMKLEAFPPPTAQTV
jgi:CelD/BcsL family acetyltransferase involved in cellulose biosynthesis